MFLSLRYWTKFTAKKLLPTPPLPLRMRSSRLIILFTGFQEFDLSDVRAACFRVPGVSRNRVGNRQSRWRGAGGRIRMRYPLPTSFGSAQRQHELIYHSAARFHPISGQQLGDGLA